VGWGGGGGQAARAIDRGHEEERGERTRERRTKKIEK
jgi:hypothetical protein